MLNLLTLKYDSNNHKKGLKYMFTISLQPAELTGHRFVILSEADAVYYEGCRIIFIIIITLFDCFSTPALISVPPLI